jgi:5-methylcytosine-specific restriction endonuclease McrA
MDTFYHAAQLPLFPPDIEHVIPDCICIGKRCDQCDQLLCLEHFHRFVYSKDGYRTVCKICRKAEYSTEEFKANRRALHKENADHVNEKKRAWHRANPEKQHIYYEKRKTEHPEQLKAAWQRANRAAYAAERHKRYRDRHPERRRAIQESWRNRHPELCILYAKARSANRKARKLQTGGSFTSKEWLDLKVKYNNTCLCCGKKEPDIKLSADHVIPLAKGGTSDIENIQPLCLTCNIRKYTKTIDYRLGMTFIQQDIDRGDEAV